MASDKLFTSRFECKYFVSPFQAEEIRRVLAFHMAMDPFCELCPDHSYLNTSLYFDSPDFLCYRSTAMGQKNRFKMRVRWYDDEEDSPVFLEEKRRTSDAISKLRAKLDRPALHDLIIRQHADPGLVLSTSPSAHARARLLIDSMQRLNMKPACHVRYLREAWIGTNQEYLRVTFDHAIAGHDANGSFARRESENWTSIGEHRPVLEIKFEGTIPNWLLGMIQSFHLVRQSVPKYLLCMDALRGKANGSRQFSLTPGGIR